MERAAVLIGVSRSGDLPTLHAVEPGVDDMREWATNQGFGRVESITDATGPVAVRQVQDAITAIVGSDRFDQLLVYFAGHGVNVGQSELWLLSDAPTYANEAVDVLGSAMLARASGIPHVVLVSDACRTAATGIQMQSVRGAQVFPNIGVATTASSVDRFAACALGSPAFEIRDPGTAADRYAAVYTAALVEALCGKADAVLDWADRTAHVRPRPLGEYLEEEVGRRLAMMVPTDELTQNPEAVISSPRTAWLSRMTGLTPSGTRGVAGAEVPVSLPGVSRVALRQHLESRQAGPAPALREAVARGVPGAGELMAATERLMTPFGPDDLPTGCGIKFRGTTAAGLLSPTSDLRVEPLGPSIVQVDLRGRRHPGLVVVELADGSGVPVPLLDGYLTSVTVDAGEVVDIGVEPSSGNYRYSGWRDRLTQLRALRAFVSSANRFGSFRLDSDDADAFADTLRVGRGVDPALALFATYAFVDIDRSDLVLSIAEILRSDVQGAILDVLRPGPRTSAWSAGPGSQFLRTVPFLARGWRQLDQFDQLDRLSTGVVERLRGYLAPSIWTQLTPRGTDLVRRFLVPVLP